MQLTTNFSSKELACPCCGKVEMDQNLLQILQDLRDEVGFSLVINSGFRCKKYNKSKGVGGSPSSQHLLGKAIDVSTRSMSSSQKHLLIKSALIKGFTGIGVYRNFFHLDVRDTPVFFTNFT